MCISHEKWLSATELRAEDDAYQRQKHVSFSSRKNGSHGNRCNIFMTLFQSTDAYLITLSNGCDFSSHGYPLGKLLLWFSWALSSHFLTLWFQRIKTGGEFPGSSICLCYGQENTRPSKSLGLGAGWEEFADSPHPKLWRCPYDEL